MNLGKLRDNSRKAILNLSYYAIEPFWGRRLVAEKLSASVPQKESLEILRRAARFWRIAGPTLVLVLICAAAYLLPGIFDYSFGRDGALAILSVLTQGLLVFLALLATFWLFRKDLLDRQIGRVEASLSRHVDSTVRTFTDPKMDYVEGDPLRYDTAGVCDLLKRAHEHALVATAGHGFETTEDLVYGTLLKIEPGLAGGIWRVELYHYMGETLRERFRSLAMLIMSVIVVGFFSFPVVLRFDQHPELVAQILTGILGLAGWAFWEMWSFVWQTTNRDQREDERARALSALGERGESTGSGRAADSRAL
jgi:hypothetical protein